MEAQQQDHGDTNTNGAVVQEASSTTPGEDVVTKRSIRVQTWRKIQQTRSAPGYTQIFNKIPDFIGSNKAAALLVDTDEFKNSVNVKVNVDRPQDPVRLQVVSNGKNLYVTPLRESNALCTKVECPTDADEQTKKRILQRLRENRNDISLENKVKFDMVIIGSVIVSRDGYRIGKGNGFVDLDLAILSHAGAITPETIIVTTVHDIQVTDSLPKDLFQKYDFPVDMIVTPTEVIRIENKLPRPNGIFWEILSERRCKIVQVLQTIKENEEKLGKVIVLKSEDTDIETNAKPQRPRPRRGMFNRFRQRPRSQGNNNNRDGSRPRRRYYNKRRIPTKSEGEQTGENKETNQNANQNNRKSNQNNRNLNQNNQQQNLRKKRNKRDYCIKVSNIARGVRVKDLKAELRKRNCNPIYISWKGGIGKCYLHFAKRKNSDKETDVDTLVDSLRDLKLTVQNGDETKVVNLSVELLQDNQQQQQQPQQEQQKNQEEEKQKQEPEENAQRIESVDVTSV